MDYGYFGFNVGALANPDSMERCVVACEQLGYESVWSGEHVILIDPHQPPSPVPPESHFLDSVASLAFAAAKTERIKIGSGIILLPQRDPIVLAKELAGIDVLSKGRLLFGLGVGYVPGEFEALGIPYEERGARTSEHIEVLRTLWSGETSDHHDGRRDENRSGRNFALRNPPKAENREGQDDQVGEQSRRPFVAKSREAQQDDHIEGNQNGAHMVFPNKAM